MSKDWVTFPSFSWWELYQGAEAWTNRIPDSTLTWPPTSVLPMKDAEAETPILWPPDAKSWLIWKDPVAGKDWRLEGKGMTEDEMVRWHHQLNAHEFGWTLGVGDGQGGLTCCGSWSRKESDKTEWLNWTNSTSGTHLSKVNTGFLSLGWGDVGWEKTLLHFRVSGERKDYLNIFFQWFLVTWVLESWCCSPVPILYCFWLALSRYLHFPSTLHLAPSSFHKSSL